jgi:hypothetical protein
MPWNKQVTADGVVTRLIESNGLYNLCNRTFDRLVVPGATSVLVPKLPSLKSRKNTGTSATHSDRKKTKTDTSMVLVDLDIHAVPIADELPGQFESGNMLTTEFEVSATMTLQEGFDADIVAAAQTTTNELEMAGETLSWKDIVQINKTFNQLKVPRHGRLIVIDAELEDQFWDIDIVKQAAAFNKEVISTGTFVTLMGCKFFISGLVEPVDEKKNIVGIYGPGLAAVLSRSAEIKQVWDVDNLQDNIDLVAHFGAKLLSNEFAVVVKEQ